jgi:hypothetical protein
VGLCQPDGNAQLDELTAESTPKPVEVLLPCIDWLAVTLVLLNPARR